MSARQWGQMVQKARNIARTLGVRRGAGYLRNREVSFAVAHTVLLGRAPRHP